MSMHKISSNLSWALFDLAKSLCFINISDEYSEGILTKSVNDTDIKGTS